MVLIIHTVCTLSTLILDIYKKYFFLIFSCQFFTVLVMYIKVWRFVNRLELIMQASEVIEILGGWKGIAKIMGVIPSRRTYHHVYSWARRDKIPAQIELNFRLTEKAKRKIMRGSNN
jgi:hypothetical protein